MIKFKLENNARRFNRVKEIVKREFVNRWEQLNNGLITHNEVAEHLAKVCKKESRILHKMLLSEQKIH